MAVVHTYVCLQPIKRYKTGDPLTGRQVRQQLDGLHVTVFIPSEGIYVVNSPSESIEPILHTEFHQVFVRKGPFGGQILELLTRY